MPNQPDNGSRLDRIERTIEHFLQLGSKHDQEIADLRDIASRTLVMLDGVIHVTAQHQGMITTLIESGKHTDGMITTLIESGKHTDGMITTLIESGKHTDERLNALIGFVAGWRNQPPPAS